jgi:hypothetical protein
MQMVLLPLTAEFASKNKMLVILASWVMQYIIKQKR